MVGTAAALAHSNASFSHGLLYMLLCVMCGFVAHGIGHTLATLGGMLLLVERRRATPHGIAEPVMVGRR